jgi:hypothetical protein
LLEAYRVLAFPRGGEADSGYLFAAAELDVTDDLKKAGLETIFHWHDSGADHDVTLMVYKDKVLVEVADVALRKKLKDRQAGK